MIEKAEARRIADEVNNLTKHLSHEDMREVMGNVRQDRMTAAGMNPEERDPKHVALKGKLRDMKTRLDTLNRKHGHKPEARP